MNTKSKQLDPRGPRFGAAITAVLFVVILLLGIPTATQPAFDAAWWLLVIATVLFGWGSLLGPSRHPYAWLYRASLKKLLPPPPFMEDEAPPRFAQTVGFVISLIGIALHLLGVPWGLVIASAMAFVAAFLNAVFGLCLGCELYSLLLRLRRR